MRPVLCFLRVHVFLLIGALADAPRATLGSVRFGSVRFGSVRFGSIMFCTAFCVLRSVVCVLCSVLCFSSFFTRPSRPRGWYVQAQTAASASPASSRYNVNDLGNIGDLIGATLDGKPPPYNAADIDLGDVRRLAGGALAALANATATVTAASLGSDAAGGGTGDDDLSDDVFDDLDDILFVQARIACLVDRRQFIVIAGWRARCCAWLVVYCQSSWR